jgi:hypothetical protein
MTVDDKIALVMGIAIVAFLISVAALGLGFYLAYKATELRESLVVNPPDRFTKA